MAARCLPISAAVAVLVLTLASSGFSEWQHSGLDSSQVDDVVFRAGNADVAYAANYGFSQGVYKSTDAGSTWTLSHASGWAHGLAVGPVGTDAVYAIHREAIFRSLDGGATWVKKNKGFSFDAGYGPSDIVVNPAHAESVYLTTGGMLGGGGVFCSPDQGDNWNRIEMPYISWKGPIDIDPLNTARIYVAEGWDGPLLRTLDGGDNWTGIYPDVIGDIAINPLNPDIIYITVSGDSAVYRSEDGGDTWTGFGAEAGLGVWATGVAVNPVNPAIVYAIGQGVYRSDDGGTAWSDFGAGLPEGEYLSSIAVDSELGTTLLVGTYQRGIYRRSESLSGVGRKTESKQVFLTASPNPFKGETAIAYQLPMASQMSIAVYDVSGREVAALVDRSEATGLHQIIWDGRDLNGRLVGPGIYYVEIQGGQASAVKPIVLLR
ncbi:MAG: FlgD immunoglobulin-like domain containing protein [Candidatus Eisenbacteria bacterium]